MRRPLPSRLLVVLEPNDKQAALLPRLAQAGARWFWLRAKHLGPAELAGLLPRFLLPGCALSLGHRDAGLPLPADCGLHLPRDGDAAAARRRYPDRLLGLSAHNTLELATAAAAGADYATLSPLFPTASKPGEAALGLAAFRQAAAGCDLPLVALGGITPERVAACRRAGAVGIAVQGAIVRSDDPAAAVRSFLQALGEP